MYRGDSFFTLTAAAQAGLALLSAMMSLALVIAVFLGARKRSVWARLGLAALAFYLFVWWSPQFYYLYYMAIIDGLPVQWVIGKPPGFGNILTLLTFGGASNLSSHGKGILGWTLLIVALCANLGQGRHR